ncbi:MAG: MBL fold metallo-hydrolase [Bacteroidales bacterium]|jgi:phosphoribosyl 1,2-cyclic phosphate phosphodiesterase|nr:MBL fold metallo-hydrolase [Bacteroidales bacterium]
MMKITILGSGTSQGVPVIGCNCDVCKSTDMRDKRLRTSILIQTEQTTICVDAGPDFRQQMLRENVQHLDAILITHHHKDHIGGLDDVRSFNFLQNISMPIYAAPVAQEEIKREYSYAFVDKSQLYPGAPTYNLIDIKDHKPIVINELTIEPIPLTHLHMLCYAFRIGNFAYVTDFNTMSDESFERLKGVEYLIIEALRHEKHYSHISLPEAIEIAQRLNVKKAWFTHVSHSMGRAVDVNKTLPQNMMLAYDGLQITVENN